MTPSQRAETLAGMATKATAITRVTLGNGECFSELDGFRFERFDRDAMEWLRIAGSRLIEAPVGTMRKIEYRGAAFGANLSDFHARRAKVEGGEVT